MELEPESQDLIITILKTLYKLTRSLRYRIYYYCDPSIAHKAQKVIVFIRSQNKNVDRKLIKYFLNDFNNAMLIITVDS